MTKQKLSKIFKSKNIKKKKIKIKKFIPLATRMNAQKFFEFGKILIRLAK